MITRILQPLLALGFGGLLLVSSFKEKSEAPIDPPFIGAGKKWVDSVMNKLTPDQRIGQLFMVAAYSNKPKAHQEEILKLILNQHIGGLIFMQGGPLRQAKLCNMYQQASNVPLMISIDGEWGLAMRLDSTMSFPKQMSLGAIQNDTLIYQLGEAIATQSKRLGIQVNFAPVVDVNNNASNPVINMRSFGENKYNVAAKGIAYMRGMQDNQILATAKHFPGHGDTETDSHKATPTINHNRARLDSLELYPFRELIRNGLGSMMVAHLSIPAIDSTRNTPATLSKRIVSDLLKNEMGFKGLVFTDALNMKGVSSFYPPGKVDVKALLAGNDVLLFSENVQVAIQEIKKAILAKDISQLEIDNRCRKILEAKYWLGLKKSPRIDLKNLHYNLNQPAYVLLNRKLTEASLTVLENDKILPLKGIDNLRIASLAIDEELNCVFQKTLNQYSKVALYSADKESISTEQAGLLSKLKGFDIVIVSVHNPKNTMSKSAGITTQLSNFLTALNKQSRVILDVFATPYSLSKLTDSATPAGLIESYEDTEISQELSAQLLFGAIKANGVLPVSVSSRYKSGAGLSLSEVIRLKFTIPEELGIASSSLKAIDSLATLAIKIKATPGCQVLVAKDGKVFFNKSYGYHTYVTDRPVVNSDLYDIASVTKVAATTISIMRLVDEGFFSLDKKVGDYIPVLNKTNKGEIRLRDLLAHQAGLPAWIPFYNKTISTQAKRDSYYRSFRTDSFPYQVAENMYMRKDYPDSMLAQIAACELGKKKEYKYSDLGYYFFKYIIEQHTKTGLDNYVDSCFYKPMGLSRITYNPLRYFSKDELVPTERDNLFRNQLIQGYVHDQGAAMLGGVGGHAGIFSNATDLAALMQMLLNGGTYGGKRFISKATIDEFTRCQFCANDNRRGLGFDKPEMNYSKTGPTCKCVSSMSFGHTGFTGTIAWVDPDQKLVYIFLSNRVYPDAENKKIQTLATRVEIQEVIYNSL
jgi:beta-glucosidase-like glycosyl hydrolase/CubicO group peptidase (beta-lactamase class C family)